MNSKEAAKLLDIDPKELRKLCRVWGFGKQIEGKWSFSKSDIARIRSHIENSGSQKREKSSTGLLTELTPEQKLIISRRDRRINAEVEGRRIARVENLERRLRAAGIHISQHDAGDDTR